MAKNKIYTPSYFVKRLIESGYNVRRVFNDFGEHDSRRWTMVVNPGQESVFVTCYTNKEELHDRVFEFNDGGKYIPKNFQLYTESIEVIINYLREYSIYGHGEEGIDKEKDHKKSSDRADKA